MNTINYWKFKSIFFITALLLMVVSQQSSAQGVGISESSITPAGSSILELRSTARGFLPPRMTTAQRNSIGTPVVGLVIYNTDTDRLNFYTGSTWIPLITADSLGTASGTSLALGGGTALTTTNRTGTGNLVLANTPTLVTPVLGVATGTSLALNGGTALSTTNQTGTGNLVLANTPTLITPVLGAATGTSLALGGGSALTTTNQTGTGNLVLSISPTLTGTPTLPTGTIATTQTFGDNTTALATTAFVQAEAPTYSRVTGANATTTGQALVDITGLTFAAAAAATYEFEAVLSCSTTAVTTGTGYGVAYSGTASAIEAHITGSSTATVTKTLRIAALNTSAQAFLTGSGQTGGIRIKGIIVTTTAGNLTIRHLKVTSGTSTVYINSFLKVTRVL